MGRAVLSRARTSRLVTILFALVTGDFNGDGRADLANATSGDISVFIGDGAGGVGPATNYAVGSYPRGIALGGFDDAGKMDLVVANSGSNSVVILSNICR
ncbi:MAG: FG-GAP repeat domain-containing protein [Pyrinomonadaceae bacterium]